MSERLTRTVPEPDGTSDGVRTVLASAFERLLRAGGHATCGVFGFGNVWTLALRLGVPSWVAPLVAPAVDLSVLGLLLGTRYLALQGAGREQLRPACRLLVFSSVMTLALNVTDPLLAGQNGKAAFDAVGPLQLIGWAEVGRGLLQAISGAGGETAPESERAEVQEYPVEHAVQTIEQARVNAERPHVPDEGDQRSQLTPGGDDLLERTLTEIAWHWETHQRPISAETLRKRPHVGSGRIPHAGGRCAFDKD